MGFDTLDPPRQEAISATDRSSNAALAASFNPETQENSNAQPAFLQNRILAQIKSRRWFNRFRILHGRRANDALAGG
jgi:hypothetical protein